MIVYYHVGRGRYSVNWVYPSLHFTAHGNSEKYAPRIQDNVTLFMVPHVSPSKVTQIFKRISARDFFRLYPVIKKHYFWGARQLELL